MLWVGGRLQYLVCPFHGLHHVPPQRCSHCTELAFTAHTVAWRRVYFLCSPWCWRSVSRSCRFLAYGMVQLIIPITALWLRRRSLLLFSTGLFVISIMFFLGGIHIALGRRSFMCTFIRTFVALLVMIFARCWYAVLVAVLGTFMVRLTMVFAHCWDAVLVAGSLVQYRPLRSPLSCWYVSCARGAVQQHPHSSPTRPREGGSAPGKAYSSYYFYYYLCIDTPRHTYALCSQGFVSVSLARSTCDLHW